MRPHPIGLVTVFFCLVVSGPLQAQEMPLSGTRGFDLVMATSPAGVSQLYALQLGSSPTLLPLGAPVNAVPSRWAHRRRTLGALETAMVFLEEGLVLTPMGSGLGSGGIHLVDLRAGSASLVAPTGNPPAYDLAVSEALGFVFAASDNGVGGTVLRGFSYGTPGQLLPLSPPSLTLMGAPAAGVSRIGISTDGLRLWVPTTAGIVRVELGSTAPHWSVGATYLSGTNVPATNPTSFERNGVTTWICGTSIFQSGVLPSAAGFFACDATGATSSGVFGIIPGLTPLRSYVPAAGTTELAVVSNGTNTYAYFLLRDPSPTAFFLRPSAVGVVRFLGASPPVVSKIIYPNEGGEPFAIPTVSGTRIAIESSQGPPFSFSPPDGGEPIGILYTPLDPLGAGTPDGVLSIAAPFGGRISTRGMDRPIWSRDGEHVIGSTSHFQGAPNPGMPGLEVLNVPAGIRVNFFQSPFTVVPSLTAPTQSIVFPASFVPNDPAAASFLDGLTVVGAVFNDGFRSLLLTPFAEIGQFQQRAVPFVLSAAIPNFPSVLPATFNDVQASNVPVPARFGARRTTFNLVPGTGLLGLAMTAAVGDRLYVQPTGVNVFATLGLFPGVTSVQPLEVALPAGWITSSEWISY